MIAASGPERILWLILILLVLSFLAGTWLNRQRAKKLARWLQEGLGVLAGKPSWRVVRSISSGAEVTITDAGRPFEWVKIGFYLLTREFPPLWGIELWRGKRDMLAVRGHLRAVPAIEWEIMPLQGRLRKLLDAKAGDTPWTWTELPASLGMATRDAAPAGLVKRARTFCERYGGHVERIALRQRNPHLLLFARFNELEQKQAAHFLRSIGELVKE